MQREIEVGRNDWADLPGQFKCTGQDLIAGYKKSETCHAINWSAHVCVPRKILTSPQQGRDLSLAATETASDIMVLYSPVLLDSACLAAGSFLIYTGVLGTFVNTP